MCQLVRLLGAVVRVLLVVLDGLNIVDQAFAALADHQPRLPVRQRLQHFLDGHEALHTVVCRFQNRQPAFAEDLRHRLAGVLLRRPHIRRGNGIFDALPCRRQRDCRTRRLGDNELGFVVLPVHIAAPGKVDRDPQAGKHIEAVVERPVFRPARVDWEILREGMHPAPELREKAAGQRVPVAVPVRPAHILRQKVQRIDIVRRSFQQVDVVFDRRFDEQIIVRVLVRQEVALDKQALDPLVPDAARVARQVHPLRKRRRASAAGRDPAELLLGKLRRFLYEDPVVFLTLILTGDSGAEAVHVAEFDGRAVFERQKMLLHVVHGNALRNQLDNRIDDAVLQILVPSSEDQDLQSRIIQTGTDRLSLRAPALAAASRTSVAGVLHRRGEELSLRFAVRLAEVDLYRLARRCSLVRLLAHAVPLCCARLACRVFLAPDRTR